MTLDNNYSALTPQSAYKVLSSPESRIVITIEKNKYAPNIEAGDVIRYDTDTQEYVRAIATNSYQAEVFGIVESKGIDDVLYVVILGSINYSGTLLNINDDNTGSNDVYFLSNTDYGKLQNIPPNLIGNVIKPIYQVSPHGNFTGVVRNYLGYKNLIGTNIPPSTEGTLLAFSENMNYSIEYDEVHQRFFINTITYSSGSFSKTQIYYFDLPTLENQSNENIDYSLDERNHECKISDNGNEILLFSKVTNKIFHINVTGNVPGNALLKAVIEEDIAGAPSDKLWAVDNELTCMTLSTKSLSRVPDSNIDYAGNSFNVSSKINYYIRSINGTNKYKWRRTAQNHAFASVKVKFTPSPARDSMILMGGAINLFDIKCRGKNFISSSGGFNNNQNLYKTKSNSESLQRYSGITLTNEKIQYSALSQINGSVKITTSNNQISYEKFLLNNIQYAIIPQIKNYNILRKINNNYYEDISYKQLTGLYDIAHPSYGSITTTQFNDIGNTPEFDIISGGVALPAYTSISFDSFPSCSSSDNYFISGNLVTYFNSNNQILNKKIFVIRYPFYSEDSYSVFKYASYSIDDGQYVPNSLYASDVGLIKEFDSSNLPEITNISFINCFTSEDRCFITTNSLIIVLTYSTLNFIKISVNNFHTAKFYYNANGEFFIVDNVIYRFNSSSSQMEERDYL